MRSVRIIFWVGVCVVVLTVAQYGSVHLLNGRPSSWIFEASLDFGPPLLFAGDIVQLTLNKGYQGPIRDQPLAFAAGVMANIAVYGNAALVIAWLFFPVRERERRDSSKKYVAGNKPEIH